MEVTDDMAEAAHVPENAGDMRRSASSGLPPRRRRAGAAVGDLPRPLLGGVPPCRQHGRGRGHPLPAQEDDGRNTNREHGRRSHASEESDENDTNAWPEDDGEDDDAHALMQTEVADGKQCGMLDAEQSESFLREIVGKIRPDMMEPAPMGIKQCLLRALGSKLPGLRAFAKKAIEELRSMYVKWKPGPAPKWWSLLWKMVRNKVRYMSRKRVRPEELEVVVLMQRGHDSHLFQLPEDLAYHHSDRYLLAKMLQRDIQLQSDLHGGFWAAG